MAAMVGNATGCAQTSSWFAKKSSKKAEEEKLAATDKKSKDKKSADKSTKAKSSKGKNELDESSPEALIAKKNKPKSIDAEHDKYAAVAAQKKKKPASSADAKKSDAGTLAKAETKAVTNDVTASVKAKPKTVDADKDDDLFSYVEQKERAAAKQKEVAGKKTIVSDTDQFEDSAEPIGKSVVQVKKEVAKSEVDEDLADWAVSSKKVEPKPTKSEKSVDIAESFEKELETPFADVAKKESSKPDFNGTDDVVAAKAVESKDAWDEESKEDSPAETKKVASVGHSQGRGVSNLCPNAEGELLELLCGIEPNDSESLKQGIYRIGQMGEQGSAAAPFLTKMLKHEDAFVRAHAALATVRLNVGTAETIVVITASLKSRDASLRSFGLAVLEEMGSKKTEVLSLLAQSLNDRDGQVRIRAAEVLIREEDWWNQAQQALINCLKDKDENIRWLTCYSLAELAPETPEAVQALMKAAHDPVPKVQVGAVYALGEIGPEAKRAKAELLKLSDSTPNAELKASIKYALEQIEAKSK